MVSHLSGSGIEIGALHNPLALPPGVAVRYVDRLEEHALRQHYPELADQALAPVSIIGDAQDLSRIADASVDFVIANHLLEHLDNPLLGMIEMFRVLRPGGLLYLALPDPRATFDRGRPLTPLEHVVSEYRHGSSETRREHFAEWVDLVEPLLNDHPHVMSGAGGSREDQINQLMDMDYSIHYHVWRPETFVELLIAARSECGLDWELASFEACDPAQDDEFIFLLRKPGEERPTAIPRSADSPAVDGQSNPSPPRPKRERLAQWLRGEGIELGALHQPLPVPERARVRYVDRLDVAGLRRHYPELEHLSLTPVSYIGSADDLSAISESSLDFVIACHVIEHVEDPTLAFSEIFRILRTGGLFYCAVPDARVTFDRHRRLTPVQHLLHDHPAGRASRRDHYVDWVDNVERHQEWWAAEQPEREARVDKLMAMDYSIHYHAWRGDTFLEYVLALRGHLGLDLEVIAYAPCEPALDDEFIVLLRKGVAPVPLDPPDALDTPVPTRTPNASAGRRTTSEVRRLGARARQEYRSRGALGLGRWLYAGTRRRLLKR